jgi:hypothetical protein
VVSSSIGLRPPGLLSWFIFRRFGCLTVLLSTLVYSGYGQRARSQDWYPVCVRRPAEITISNKASIKGEDCLQTSVLASLKGLSGYVHTFRFRDGAVIRVFQPECAERFGPCRIEFSIGGSDWEDGVYELPSALSHDCGEYTCNWHAYRDGYGKLVIATGMSY